MKLPSLTLLLASAALVGCSTQAADHEPSAAVPDQDALVVAAESLRTVVPVHGSVEARETAELATRMMAHITALPVEVGARVSRGQTLIRLGAEDIEAKRLEADAAHHAATVARDEAERQANRMLVLFEQDVVPLVDRDAAQLRLAQAEAELARAEAALRDVRTALSYSSIKAPFDGVVTRRYVDLGDLAAPGRPLLTIEATGTRDAVIYVPVDLAQGLEVGTPVPVQEAGGRKTVAALRAIAGGADPRSRTVEVRISLPADWPTGAAVTAMLPGAVRLGIAIPKASVLSRGQLTGVRVLTEQGVTLRWVRLGRDLPPLAQAPPDQQRVEVLTGLEPGDRILP